MSVGENDSNALRVIRISEEEIHSQDTSVSTKGNFRSTASNVAKNFDPINRYRLDSSQFFKRMVGGLNGKLFESVNLIYFIFRITRIFTRI